MSDTNRVFEVGGGENWRRLIACRSPWILAHFFELKKKKNKEADMQSSVPIAETSISTDILNYGKIRHNTIESPEVLSKMGGRWQRYGSAKDSNRS